MKKEDILQMMKGMRLGMISNIQTKVKDNRQDVFEDLEKYICLVYGTDESNKIMEVSELWLE